MIDAVKLFRERNVPYLDGSGHHHCKEGWVQTHCPFCAGGRSGWHLGFAKESGTFRCWRCGTLRFWETLAALVRVDKFTLSELVKRFQVSGGNAVRAAPVARQRTLKRPPDCGPLQPAHASYLRGRGFDPEQVEAEWGLLGTGPCAGGWSWRVVIPVHNGAGRLVAWQGRSIGTADPKYKFSRDEECLEDPDGLVYGLDRVRGDGVLIYEGCPSVWRFGPGAVGLFGIDWKKQQAARLRRFKRRHIAFDPEPQAQARAAELAAYLSLFPGVTEILSGFNTDPGEFSLGRVRRLRADLGL